MKAKRPFEKPLPRSLTPFIDRYLEHYRPTLIALSGKTEIQHLWITQYGLPLSYDGVFRRYRILSARYFKTRSSPHRARHALASTIVLKAPEKSGAIGPLLAQLGSATWFRHYARGKRVAGGKAWAEIVEDLRSSAEAGQAAPAGKPRRR